MYRILHAAVAIAGLGLVLSACTDASARDAHFRTAAASAASASAVYSRFGAPVRVGNGVARAYVDYDAARGDVPVEIGVALDEQAMAGLPGPNPHVQSMPASGHEHVDNHVYMLALPAGGAPPFQFVELDWNPGGHEPPGIYDEPHFDFHFYVVPPGVRAGIVPDDPDFQRNADMLPPESQRAPFYAVAAPPGATSAPGVPLMGVHWIDVRSPELQKMLGNPDAWRPFTTTFLYGSWAGRFHFLEPMITRSYIMSKKEEQRPEKRNEIIAISSPSQVDQPGYYPSAYRIAWDDQAKVYRVALTSLEQRAALDPRSP